jgi:hypothetical protein
MIVKAILCAMGPMMQIGVLILFAIVLFAIIALEFYLGVFHYACYDDFGRHPASFTNSPVKKVGD